MYWLKCVGVRAWGLRLVEVGFLSSLYEVLGFTNDNPFNIPLTKFISCSRTLWCLTSLSYLGWLITMGTGIWGLILITCPMRLAMTCSKFLFWMLVNFFIFVLVIWHQMYWLSRNCWRWKIALDTWILDWVKMQWKNVWRRGSTRQLQKIKRSLNLAAYVRYLSLIFFSLSWLKHFAITVLSKQYSSNLISKGTDFSGGLCQRRWTWKAEVWAWFSYWLYQTMAEAKEFVPHM